MVRRGSHADVTFMRSMLTHAYHWRVAGFDDEIPLSRYTENWGRSDDPRADRDGGRHRSA
jgi:hypothetical protein